MLCPTLSRNDFKKLIKVITNILIQGWQTENKIEFESVAELEKIVEKVEDEKHGLEGIHQII